MTRLEMQTEILDLCHMTNDTTYVTRVNRWINMAYRKLYRHHNWRWWEGSAQITTVSGTEAYAIATDCNRVLGESVRIGSNILEPADITYFDLVDPARSNRGKPRYFAAWAGQLLFHDVPNAAYTVDYRYKTTLTTLTADSETDATGTPVFGSEYHDILVYGGLIVAQEESDDLQLSVRAEGHYNEILADMIANESLIDAPPRQGSISWFNDY